MYPYLITSNTVTLIYQGETLTVTSTHPTFDEVCDLIRKGEWDTAATKMRPALAISSYAEGMEIRDGSIYLDGEEIDHGMVPHILAMKEKGFDISPLLSFLQKVLDNPSMRSRNQIWRFVSTNNIAITPEGNLLFYKRVKDNYYDIHTGGTFQYLVGSTITMPRHDVDDDPESTCSHGLHVCSYEYLKSFSGDRTLLCEVNPADIVSVPIDYKNTKVRVCCLTVKQEVSNPKPLGTSVYDECPF